MATRRIEHVFDCNVETFWEKIFLDDEFNRQLFVGRLGFASWKVLECAPTDDGLRRVVEAVPSVGELPGPLRKALANGLGYREEGQLFRSESRYSVRVVPASLPQQLDISGELRVVPDGAGCRRIYDATVNARLFMVGSLLETRLLDDITKSYEVAAAFSRERLSHSDR